MSMTNWKSDPHRELLKNDILQGIITPEMKPVDACECRPEYKSMGKRLFASRLTGMRKSLAVLKTSNGKKEDKWNKTNPIRTQLKDDLANEFIPTTMDAATAWHKRPEYKEMELNLWKSRFNGMRKIVREGKERASSDAIDLSNDRKIHPRPQVNERGTPLWIGSDAEVLLGIDIDDGKHKEMEPKQLYESRQQYQDFTLQEFRRHIYQEEQTRKWRKQWVDGKKQYALVPKPN